VREDDVKTGGPIKASAHAGTNFRLFRDNFWNRSAGGFAAPFFWLQFDRVPSFAGAAKDKSVGV
jgi:hypothetical protein